MNQQQKRIGVIAIIVKDPANTHEKLNSILHYHSNLIVGRLGVPRQQEKLSIISLIVEGTTDEVGALTGKLGQLPSVSVKTAFAK
ncbi:MAG: TM1266 family iron-only hydrogenase system putative regulator [Fidelibacterota bacterium]